MNENDYLVRKQIDLLDKQVFLPMSEFGYLAGKAVLKMDKTIEQLTEELKAALERERGLLEALIEYGEHQRECILSRWEAGEPTADGGYRSKYGGKWYQTKPVDNTPKCGCGLEEALSKSEVKL